jgi:hypothetical protein
LVNEQLSEFGTRGTFEEALNTAQRAATAVADAAKALQQASNALVKVATSGDVAKLHAEVERIKSLTEAVRLASLNAANAWPFREEQEEQYLQGPYLDELRKTAANAGVDLRPYGGGFAAFPCLITIEPASRTARIDRQRTRALRPSALVKEIAAVQARKPRLKPEQFIEVLHRAYLLVVGEDRAGSGATLNEVYDALTLLPGSTREYGKAEFVRDVHLLNRSGVTTTRRGAALNLPASTGTKTKANVLDIVDERGERHLYYGISFGTAVGEGER